MSKVLGSFSADEAALHIAKRNIKPDDYVGNKAAYFYTHHSILMSLV